MAILKIAKMGHPVLAGIAEPVQDPTDPRVHRLIADMVDTMLDAPGVGLAAPQVHAAKRIIVFHVPAERNDDEEVPLTALINPTIEPLTDERELGVERCLSLPGMAGQVPRYTRIRYTGLASDGSSIEREAGEFHARVVQHEYDHLDGLLYPMRMEDLSTFGYVEEMSKNPGPPGAKVSDDDR